jgi:membrane associated rhomboid family serine protease
VSAAGSPPPPVTCYRHPDRPAPLGCTRCSRPICIDDAIDAPVGYLCPECARQPANVRRAHRRMASAQNARATTTLLVLIGVVYVAQLAFPELWLRGALNGFFIAQGGEWWRIVTSGFLHSQNLLLHVAFNGYLLYLLGQMLEPGIGTNRFAAVYFAGLFGGSAGALALSWASFTIGASGAVFGLMGAAMVLLRKRGINPWKTSIGTLVLINLAFTFLAPGISIGGHVGGIIGGALAALPLTGEHGGRDTAIAWVIAAALAGVALYAGVAGPLVG